MSQSLSGSPPNVRHHRAVLLNAICQPLRVSRFQPHPKQEIACSFFPSDSNLHSREYITKPVFDSGVLRFVFGDAVALIRSRVFSFSPHQPSSPVSLLTNHQTSDNEAFSAEMIPCDRCAFSEQEIGTPEAGIVELDLGTFV